MGSLFDLGVYVASREARARKAARTGAGTPTTRREPTGDDIDVLLARIAELRPLIDPSAVAPGSPARTELLAAIGATTSGLYAEAAERIARLTASLEAERDLPRDR